MKNAIPRIIMDILTYTSTFLIKMIVQLKFLCSIHLFLMKFD